MGSRARRATWADDLETEAAILALAVQPALSFEDAERAQRNLSALQARASIQAAALYRPDGAVFASFVRPEEPPPPASAPAVSDGTYIGDGRVEVVTNVTQSGEVLGRIYLRALHDVTGRVRAYLLVLGSVMVVGLIAAVLVSSWLQRVVSEPMESMANVARQIVQQREYSFRAAKTTDDEIGVVVDAFNKMLDEVESRSRALETSEKLYRAIGESINYGVWVCDAQGRNIYASDSLLRLIGMTLPEVIEFGWLKVLHPDDVEDTLAAWQECVRAGGVWYREHRILGVDGKYHAVLAQGVPIRNAEGRIERWAGINLDILPGDRLGGLPGRFARCALQGKGMGKGKFKGGVCSVPHSPPGLWGW